MGNLRLKFRIFPLTAFVENEFKWKKPAKHLEQANIWVGNTTPFNSQLLEQELDIFFTEAILILQVGNAVVRLLHSDSVLYQFN